MNYRPEIHNRRSMRLKGYDYSQQGLYFVTICTQNRECLFGEIIDGGLHNNTCGKMIGKWVGEIENKFDDVYVLSYVIMPNHFHAIIANTGANVGADLCVCPKNRDNQIPGERVLGEHIGSLLQNNDNRIPGEHIGSPLHRVVQWFKTMTANEYIRGVKTLGWKPFNRKLWQRNYYEHIIRNEQSCIEIARYIKHNPEKWHEDSLYMQPGKD